MSEKIAVIGLGYVGLPLAVALAESGYETVGFDISKKRVLELRAGTDRSQQISDSALRSSGVRLTHDQADIREATFYIVTVPTPIDHANQPDLSILESACETVGRVLDPGNVVVFESTVYPGVTRDHCGAILEDVSGLRKTDDFHLGYSPERINPGDREHRLETIVKVVAGDTEPSLDRIASVYESVVRAGVHRAASLEVAEAAKVIENTQRDLNIALMNELSLIFDKLGLRTKDVLDAASTKWNFLNFHPGLVGGHCIGVDPYYLTYKAEAVGYHPQVILAGRRINDSMGKFVAQKTVKLLIERDRKVQGATVGIAGLTFKENVSDIRNSRVPDIVDELDEFGVTCVVHDPLADPEEARDAYNIRLSPFDELRGVDALILAVTHDDFLENQTSLTALGDRSGIILDVKSALSPKAFQKDTIYWSL